MLKKKTNGNPGQTLSFTSVIANILQKHIVQMDEKEAESNCM